MQKNTAVALSGIVSTRQCSPKIRDSMGVSLSASKPLEFSVDRSVRHERRGLRTAFFLRMHHPPMVPDLGLVGVVDPTLHPALPRGLELWRR